MHLPRATYRVQLQYQFGFKQLEGILSYLSDLGISDVYASPIFKARKQSMHGYDIVDPNQLNPELGGEKAFQSLIAELKRQNLYWLQDIVPNHMAYDSQNYMLMDVLENGKDSSYFNFFDIDWEHAYENMKGRILAPLLGKFYAEALEAGEIQLKYDERGVMITYYELSLPLRVDSYAHILEHNIFELEETISADNPDFIKLLGAIHLFKSLASHEGDVSQSEQMRHTKKMMWSLYQNNEQIRLFIDRNLEFFNGVKGDAASFDALDKLLSQQLFRLSFWKVASEEINYRRFFTVNELICVRVEEDEVFEYTHKLILQLIREGVVHALRIDHIDGLYDPTRYLKKLRDHLKDVYIVVEKILANGEHISSRWSVQGTTGYDFMNYINGLFCYGAAKRAFTKIYQSFSGIITPYEELVCEKKRMIISKHLAGNVDNLAHLLKRISSGDKYGRDITLYGLRRALVEVMASFPVYRTYIDLEARDENDFAYIREAIARAKRILPGFFYELNFIEKFLLLEYSQGVGEEDKKDGVNFVMNFQQYTGPLMAKGFEDTVLYIYNRLISLNEVGSSPETFGCSLKEFHDFNLQRVTRGGYSFNATATHDTKRGEDVRARINVLSEIPYEWEQNLKQWAKLNKQLKRKINGGLAPDANDEYFLYQTLLGSLPFSGADEKYHIRIKEYIIKSVREAKRHTAWIKPDLEYEKACLDFVDALLSERTGNQFMQYFLPFQHKISWYGMLNGLSQTMLKVTSPGVADFYQGTELWDFHLVDPDNREAVDFEKRAEILAVLKKRIQDNTLELIPELFQHKDDGRLKMFVCYKALQTRKEKSLLFEKGTYIPVEVMGVHKNNVVAFVRQYEQEMALVVVPRFLTQFTSQDELPCGEAVWADTHIVMPPAGAALWTNYMTGGQVEHTTKLFLSAVLKHFPVALLVKTR